MPQIEVRQSAFGGNVGAVLRRVVIAFALKKR
jgi:hypothetical protein